MTIPSCYYLWPSASHAEHHGDHEAHGEEHEESEEGEGKEDASAAHSDEEATSGEVEDGKDDSQTEAESNQAAKETVEGKHDPEDDDDSQTEEGSNIAAQETLEGKHDPEEKPKSDKPSGTEGEGQELGTDANKASSGSEEAESKPTPENKGSVEGVTFKGPVAGDGKDDTRKREPDSKGGFKKRIDSGLGKDLGAGADKDEDGNENVSGDQSCLDVFRLTILQAATSKPGEDLNAGDISTKQKGISSTATRHSTQIDQDPEKSKKGEGTPETAKAQGTVQVDRPQV